MSMNSMWGDARLTDAHDGRSDPNELRHGPPGDPALSRLILSSYELLTGSSLVPSGMGDVEAVGWLYKAAPFCVLAHDTASDPRFLYANTAAQRCFEYSWAEFTQLPSRLSAEAPDRTERQSLLDQVARQGYASGYRGLRISRSGRRFWIEDGTVWQMTDAGGTVHGQAAVFPRWQDVVTDGRGPA